MDDSEISLTRLAWDSSPVGSEWHKKFVNSDYYQNIKLTNSVSEYRMTDITPHVKIDYSHLMKQWKTRVVWAIASSRV